MNPPYRVEWTCHLEFPTRPEAEAKAAALQGTDGQDAPLRKELRASVRIIGPEGALPVPDPAQLGLPL